MARLPEATIKQVFNLQQELLECIHEATATEFIISENLGETDVTIEYFEQLQNARERADTYYLRLFTEEQAKAPGFRHGDVSDRRL